MRVNNKILAKTESNLRIIIIYFIISRALRLVTTPKDSLDSPSAKTRRLFKGFSAVLFRY
jgi:hypothetical protein